VFLVVRTAGIGRGADEFRSCERLPQLAPDVLGCLPSVGASANTGLIDETPLGFSISACGGELGGRRSAGVPTSIGGRAARPYRQKQAAVTERTCVLRRHVQAIIDMPLQKNGRCSALDYRFFWTLAATFKRKAFSRMKPVASSWL
jgi:hypothetical protein